MKKILSIVISAVLLVLTLTATVSVETSAVNTSQSYKVYNATTGSYIKSYTLAQNAVEDKSRTVIGTDDRMLDFTKSGVVKIVTQGGLGTGFVVDAHTIATVAHCPYIRDEKNPANGRPVPIAHIYIFNADKSIAMDITNPSQMHIPTIFTTNAEDAVVYDYALITVPQDLSAYANFTLGAPLDNFIYSGKRVFTTGFPGEVRGQTVNSYFKHNMYTCSGVMCADVHRADLEISYKNDMSEGDSGAPVYTISTLDDKTYYTVVGINAKFAGEANRAVRITTDLLHFYKNNPNITY